MTILKHFHAEYVELMRERERERDSLETHISPLVEMFMSTISILMRLLIQGTDVERRSGSTVFIELTTLMLTAY